MMTKTIPRSLIAAAATVLIASTIPGAANAQSDNWGWGGGNTVGGSGREVVKFNSQFSTGQIVVSFGDRRLYHVVRQGEAVSYPIAIPREQSRWQGVTSVSMKRENPSWTPTPTMRAENPRLPMWVPGGHPMNPLGNRALYLGSSAYRIHGTDAPWTIGAAVSKGCIRMYNQDVADLYPRVAVGTKVTVTWQTFRGGPPVADAGQRGPASAERPQTQRRRTASAEAPPSAFSTPVSAYEDDDRPRRRVTTTQAQPRKTVKRAPRVTSADVAE
jgi:lipoprotein-anchoring transpeptidase ErfK/SrfK